MPEFWKVARSSGYERRALVEEFKRRMIRIIRRKCHIQVHLSRNYIPTVISSPNYTSLPSTVATFLTTHLMAVLQPSGYSVFHSGDTPIQLSLP